MHKFTLPEHRAQYTSFYQNYTGKVLPDSSHGALPTKRQGVSFTSKEVPEIKVQKKVSAIVVVLDQVHVNFLPPNALL